MQTIPAPARSRAQPVLGQSAEHKRTRLQASLDQLGPLDHHDSSAAPRCSTADSDVPPLIDAVKAGLAALQRPNGFVPPGSARELERNPLVECSRGPAAKRADESLELPANHAEARWAIELQAAPARADAGSRMNATPPQPVTRHKPAPQGDADDFWSQPLSSNAQLKAGPFAPAAPADSQAAAVALAPSDVPTSAPQTPVPAPQSELIAFQRDGQLIGQMSAGLAFGYVGQAHFQGQVSVYGGQFYREDLLIRCGDPADPIERMLIEQIAILHQHALQLHMKAAAAQGTEATKILCNTAARFAAEVGRLAERLQAYRAHPAKPRSRRGQRADTSAKKLRGSAKPPKKQKRVVNTQLRSKGKGTSAKTKKPPKSKPRCCR